jgi:hypothetical protein
MAVDTVQKRQKSRDYPAVSLRKAVDFARMIYEKDRWAESPASVAVKHMGYSGLNGGSRTALSALKKFGLVEYLGSGDNLKVRLSDLAKRIILPVNQTEQGTGVWEALDRPAIYSEIFKTFPDRKLPSDDTLAARLEREFGLQHGAVASFISDLKASLDFARSFDVPAPSHVQVSKETEVEDEGADYAPLDSQSAGRDVQRIMKIPMPGSATYIMLPEALSATEARRVLLWLKRVVTPAIEFASESGGENEKE